MTAGNRTVVAVVGGGIAGLAAAWEVVTGSLGREVEGPQVHVFEAADRIGGKLASATFAGRRVDLAADAFLGRWPEATELCDELGIGPSLLPVGAQGASIWARGRLRLMPEGLQLGIPTRWWPLLRSGILSRGESVRVAKDLVVPHLRTGMVFGDRAVGQIVEERLGRPVVDRLVDPLIGGIHASGVDALSTAATFPLLLAASHQSGSLMRRLGQAVSRSTASSSNPAGAVPPPAFWSLPGSTASLVDLLADALARRGVTIHTGTAVDAMDRVDSGRWQLALGPTAGLNGSGAVGGGFVADGVVLALPATESAVLLAPHAPEAAGILSSIRYASVAVVTLAFPDGVVVAPLTGTGFLVPRTSLIDGRPALMTGATYLSRKWPHLARPGDELIRASVGRFGDERHAGMDDDELTASVRGELARYLGIRDAPTESLVTRWDHAFPQYEVGHLLRVARIEQAVSALDRVAVAGAALRGVGIPACIGSGRSAGRRVLAALETSPGGLGSGGPTP